MKDEFSWAANCSMSQRSRPTACSSTHRAKVPTVRFLCIFISVLFAFLTFHSYFVFVVIHFACIFVFVTVFHHRWFHLSVFVFSKDCAAFPRIMIWFSSHRYHHAAISEIDKKSVRWRRDHHCAQMAPFNARLEYNQPTFLPYHVVIQAKLAVPYF